MFKVCEFVFIKNGFHETHHPPTKLIQVGPGCCDKCLTTCPKFSLKIEWFNLDFNIIALNFTNQSQTVGDWLIEQGHSSLECLMAEDKC